MLFIWVIDGRKLKRIALILIAAFFAALVAFVQSQEVTVFSTAKGPRALSKVETTKSQIALTFDIGWGDVRIEPILKYLDEENVKATFFVSGEWADQHKELIQTIKEHGFEIGSHGYRHKSYLALDSSAIRKDIMLASNAIEKAGAKRPTFIRPPEGAINNNVLQTATHAHQQVILWSVNPQDTTNPGYQKIASYVIDHSGKGDIILLHASDSAKQTYRALPIIVSELRDKGLSFVTLSTLISNAKVNTKLIK